MVKVLKMTKKMTITLEERLIDELSATAYALGKKKTQVVREALQNYLGEIKKEQDEQQWKTANKEAIAAYNERVESQGVFSDKLRLF